MTTSPKPYAVAEVIVRLQVVLRRAGLDSRSARVGFADIELDADTGQVWKGGAPISLTANEFAWLHFLVSNPGRVHSTKSIMAHVWPNRRAGGIGVVQTYVSYLRRKLDTDTDETGGLVRTVPGRGYALRSTPSDRTALRSC